MENITLHVEDKKNLRISAAKRKDYIYIKGYNCTENCTECHLHKVGEDLEKLNKTCNKLDKKDVIVEMKLEFNLSEKISFT